MPTYRHCGCWSTHAGGGEEKSIACLGWRRPADFVIAGVSHLLFGRCCSWGHQQAPTSAFRCTFCRVKMVCKTICPYVVCGLPAVVGAAVRTSLRVKISSRHARCTAPAQLAHAMYHVQFSAFAQPVFYCLALGSGATYCDQRLDVCLFVCLPARISQKLYIHVQFDPIFSTGSGYVHIWVGVINPTFFCRLFKGHCYSNRFWRKSAKIGIPHFHSVRWHFTTDGRIATRIRALTPPMTPLRLITIW